MNTEIHDIYPLIYQPFWRTTTFAVIFLFCCACALITLGYVIIKHYKRMKIPVLSAWDWAFQELEAIDPYEYRTKQEFKEYYFTLTEIMKRYLVKRYQWEVQDKTDAELIRFLATKKMDPAFIEQLNMVLQGALLTKFANAQTLKEQAFSDKETLISLIASTIPQQSK